MKDLMNATTQQTMSSLEIAELTGKRHDNVIRDIRNMMEELGALKTEASSYKTSQGKELPCYNLNKELTMTLVTGYSIKLRNAKNTTTITKELSITYQNGKHLYLYQVTRLS